VTLYIESFFADQADVIKTIGGKGQGAGEGQDGGNGKNCKAAQLKGMSLGIRDGLLLKIYPTPADTTITYYEYKKWGDVIIQAGDENCTPRDGEDGKTAGKPGEGGKGGKLFSTVDIDSRYYSTDGGAAGDMASKEVYKGGLAGKPEKSVKVYFYNPLGTIYYRTKPRDHPPNPPHKTRPGADSLTSKGARDGSSGGALQLLPLLSDDYPEFAWISPEFAWMHPLLVRKVMDRVKEDYLAGRIMEVKYRMLDYAALLKDYIADTSYQKLDESSQHDLEVIYNDMQTLLHRIQNNLDCFGNPAGWVPMLSFEVTLAMFDTEIERAIDMLYLSHWIGTKAQSETRRMGALQEVRDHLWEEFEEAQYTYNDLVVNKLPLLLSEGGRLENQTAALQNELRFLESELLNQATEAAEPQPWEIALRLGLKTSAVLCKALPVPYVQPRLGELGGGLLETASNIDFGEPWNFIFELPDVADSYANTKYNQAVSGLNRAMLGVKDQPDKEKKRKQWKEARRVTGAVADGVKGICSTIEQLKAPQAEIIAEVERLKEKDPQYQDVVERIKEHLDQKTEYAQELAEVMQEISTLADTIDENIMAVDALSRDIADGIVIDDRAMVYLESLAKRAYDRLLKYHYYMAKAYEYRLLAPYTNPLDLQGLIEEFVKIGSADSHEITDGEFKSLKDLYRLPLTDTAEEIFKKYNDSGVQESTWPVEFNLTADELARLNKGETIRLNVWERDGNDLFFPDEENVRIVDLKIKEIETEPEGGAYGSSARLRVQIQHSGFSNLKLDGVVHQFRHYNQDTRNAITWAGIYDPVGDVIVPDCPAAADNSLLISLLSSNAQSDMLLYSRPSVWADLDMSRSITGNEGRGITIKHLRLSLQYDYTPRDNRLGLWDISVVPCPYPTWGSDLTPYFSLSRADINNRQDAWGSFLRIFRESNTEAVSIQAQEHIGKWVFRKWADKYGNDLPDGPFTDPAIDLIPNEDLSLCAAYRYQRNAPDDIDSDLDGLPDHLENITCTDAYDADTDDDGIPDGVEDGNGNGVRERGETDSCNADTDGDGIQDGTELGFTLETVGADTDLSIFIPDSTPERITNPLLNPGGLIPAIQILLMDEEETPP
jgi:hypothetical protein